MGPYDHDEENPEDAHTPLLNRRTSSDSDLKYPLSGGAGTWATWGLAWSIMSLTVIIRWIASPTEFQPSPHVNGVAMPTWRLVLLRLVEVLSTLVLGLFIFYCVAKPLYLRREFNLDGKFVIGGLIALVSDGFLNGQQYIFAWNSYAVNRGSWAEFMPFHNPEAPTRYTESLLWGPPMYVYFCAGVAIVGTLLHGFLRRKMPTLSNEAIFAIVWIDAFVFDFCVETTIISTTHAYAFAKTYGPLTIMKGQTHQFPLYESMFVATLGTLFTWMRVQAKQDVDGLSPLERGYQRWNKGIGTRGWGSSWLGATVRSFAVIGFCSAACVLCYHLPLNWFGVIGTCVADLPDYLKPGEWENGGGY
ncbi:hypothetical protein K432DRAFT_439417, partial [Lepidopterella palustris CBS 459.81]